MFFATEEYRDAFASKVAADKKARVVKKDAARGPHRRAWYLANRERVLAQKKAARDLAFPNRVQKTPAKSKPPKLKAAKQAKAKHTPKPITLAKTKGKTPPVVFATAEADYSRAVVTVAPTPRPRFAVELAKGHVSALDPQQCRPWAMAAARQPVTAAIQPVEYLIG